MATKREQRTADLQQILLERYGPHFNLPTSVLTIYLDRFRTLDKAARAIFTASEAPASSQTR